MPVSRNEYNEKSKGGTELSIAELEAHVDSDLLSKFQIIPSRFRGLEEGLIPLYWLHDLADDPEMHHLADGGWRKFRKLVFVSNWQMQQFILRYNIPWQQCVQINNGIVPFPKPKAGQSKWDVKDGAYRFIYHTTPHRGLNVLAAVFPALRTRWPRITLDVYSSFSIYGWNERDRDYQDLYNTLASTPGVTYHGARSNEEIRAACEAAHFFLYPCTWPETGCRALIEAMMAGVYCVHSNFGCLYETALGRTAMYQYHEDLNDHANIAYISASRVLQTVADLEPKAVERTLASVRATAELNYSWPAMIGPSWNRFLRSQIG